MHYQKNFSIFLSYISLLFVIAFGLLTIMATGGGDGDDMDVIYDNGNGYILPLFIEPEFVEGRRYHTDDSEWTSLDWELEYQVRRDTLWDLFRSDPGEYSSESGLGQEGFLELVYIPDTGEMETHMHYEGFESRFQYSLASKAGYSSGSIFIIISRYTTIGEFLPYTLQIYQSFGSEWDYNRTSFPIFELEVQEDYPFGVMKEYPLSKSTIGSLAELENVSLYLTTSSFKSETSNPIPINPNCDDYDAWTCIDNYEVYLFSNIGGVYFYITLQE